MSLNGVMAVTLRYFTNFGEAEFQHITASVRMKFIDQMSASITQSGKVCVCNQMHAFPDGHEASGKSRISALLILISCLKFRFTVAFFVLMLGVRLTSSCSHYNYALLCSIGEGSAPTINFSTPCLVFISEKSFGQGTSHSGWRSI